MRAFTFAPRMPAHIWVLAALYTVASLAHFVHNAEYLAYYPNMPAWVRRETVYQVWLAIAAFGAAGALIAMTRWRVVAALLLAVYGAFGLDGLGHYALALCSEHTWTMNATIWSEASTGVVLAASCVWFAVRGRRAGR